MVRHDKPSRGDVFLVRLDPTLGGGIRKTRPCLIVSPDEVNRQVRTSIVAPLTTGSHDYPFRVPCEFQGKRGHVVLDQIRTVDRDRLVEWLGSLLPRTVAICLSVLREMFAT